MAIPQGICEGTVVIQGEQLENRKYSLADATELRALFFADAPTIREGYITMHFDVKAGSYKRIYREEFDSEFESSATGGRNFDECGGFVSKGDYSKPTDKYIKGHYLYREYSLCLKQLLGKWKQGILARGANRIEEQTTSLNDWLMEKDIRNANIQIEELIWKGDYKCGVKKLAHFDGIIKKLFQATGASVAHVERWVFSGLASGDVIEGFAGGVPINVPFNTDNATTVADLATALSALDNPYTGSPIYTVTNTPAGTVTITANVAGTPNNVSLAVTDGTGVDRCYNSLVAGTGTFVYTEVTANVEGDEPIMIPYTVITASNVLSEMEKLYTAVANVDTQKGRGLLQNPNMRLFVPTAVLKFYELAVKKIATDTSGIQGIFTEGMVVGLPYLPPNVMIMADPANLHFATDLISDMEDIDVWSEKKEQLIYFRSEMVGGVQIDRFSEVACNFTGAPFSFQPAQPETPPA